MVRGWENVYMIISFLDFYLSISFAAFLEAVFVHVTGENLVICPRKKSLFLPVSLFPDVSELIQISKSQHIIKKSNLQFYEQSIFRFN